MCYTIFICLRKAIFKKKKLRKNNEKQKKFVCYVELAADSIRYERACETWARCVPVDIADKKLKKKVWCCCCVIFGNYFFHKIKILFWYTFSCCWLKFLFLFLTVFENFDIHALTVNNYCLNLQIHYIFYLFNFICFTVCLWKCQQMAPTQWRHI